MKTHNVLAIETTSPQLTLSLGKAGKLYRTFKGPHAWRHAEVIFRGLETLFKKARWKPSDLSAIVVATGPGSFTGIRIGLALARTLGQFLKIPVRGVNSLQLMASSIQTSGICISILDALRDEYFVGVYQMPDCKPLLSEARLPAKKVEALLRRYAKYQKPIFVCGASERFRSCLSARATVGAAFPVAADLLRWADHTLTQKAYPYERIQPVYLREASAVERRHKK